MVDCGLDVILKLVNLPVMRASHQCLLDSDRRTSSESKREILADGYWSISAERSPLIRGVETPDPTLGDP